MWEHKNWSFFNERLDFSILGKNALDMNTMSLGFELNSSFVSLSLIFFEVSIWFIPVE